MKGGNQGGRKPKRERGKEGRREIGGEGVKQT